MFNRDRRSFFERITGSVITEDTPEIEDNPNIKKPLVSVDDWTEDTAEEDEGGELAIDLYQKQNEIVLQAMIAGVKPENLNISITRENVVLEGRRERPSEASGSEYLARELYWGSFVRTVNLPAEVEPEEAEAFEKHGLLTIRMPKIDKAKTQKLKVRALQ